MARQGDYRDASRRAVLRLLELNRAAAVNKAGVDIFKGLSVGLTLLYEEFTGNYLHNHKVTPLDVFQWAETVKRTGDL